MTIISEIPLKSNVIVIGGGLAGLCATIESYRLGAKVILIDKEASVGGNSAKASSGINAVNTITDSDDTFVSDTILSGGNQSDPILVQTLVTQSSTALAWLESFGILLNNVSQCGGHSMPRTHRESPRDDGKPVSVGWDIVKALKAYIDKEMANKSDPKFGSISILNKCRVIELLVKDGQIHGVTSEMHGNKQNIESDAVILTTGGFSANREMIKKHAPELSDLPTTNGDWATGDGIQLLIPHNVEFKDMEYVQVHPTGFIDPNDIDAHIKFLAPEALRGHGGLLLSVGNAVRFTNELGPRNLVVHDFVTGSTVPQLQSNHKWPRSGAFLLLNQAAVDLFDRNLVQFYTKRGLFKVVDSGIQGLVQLLRNGVAGLSARGTTVESLQHTFETYSLAAQGIQSDAFGKRVFPVTFSVSDTFYVAGVTPVIHYTMGGVRINAAAEVLRPSTDPLQIGPNGNTFPGLFAAGEVTGGVHGKNRLAGNSLLECVVFGRIAGQRAAAVSNHLISAFKSFVPLRLRSTIKLSRFTSLFQFDLPSPLQTTGLDSGEYVSVRAEIDGKSLIRFYSPISPLTEFGHLDILLKVEEKGEMSHHISQLRPGIDSLDFQWPFGTKFTFLDMNQSVVDKSVLTSGSIHRIGLVAGGTGISPMIQIIRFILLNNRLDLRVKLIYGAVNETELVFKPILQQLTQRHANIETFFMVNEPSDTWPQDELGYGVGLLTEEVLSAQLPAPGNDVKVIVCGPLKMCTEVKKSLVSLGYLKDMWYSFM